MSATIGYEDFQRVELRIGTIVSARANEKARKPAYVIEVDLGAAGVRTSSAQITDHYAPGDLLGRQVVCVVNFEPKRTAGVKSEVLILGAVQADDTVVLLQPGQPVADGVPAA